MSRYKIYGSDNSPRKYYIEIIDNKTDIIYTENHNNIADLLNQQDEKIQELEDKVFELNTKLNLKEHEPAFCKLAGKDCEFMGRIKKLDYENQKLFEDLYCEPNNKRLAIKELENMVIYTQGKTKFMVAESLDDKDLSTNYSSYFVFSEDILNYLDQRIKELRGEEDE